MAAMVGLTVAILVAAVSGSSGGIAAVYLLPAQLVVALAVLMRALD